VHVAPPQEGVGAVQAFSADLYRALAAKPGNRVCSPYSVAVALAMARNGARGATATEIDQVLHAPTLDELNRGLSTLERLLESRTGEQDRGDGSTVQITLNVANSLWGQDGTAWEEPFLDTLADDYGTDLQLVDFIHSGEDARVRINAWTASRTNDRIPQLVPEDTFDVLTRLVLVNAIYLKAPWEEPFDAAQTRPAPFTKASGSTVDASMMHASLASAGYASGAGWEAVDLRYAGSRLAMALVLPDRDGLGAYEQALDGERLNQLLAGFVPTHVEIGLPRWTFRTQASLKDTLTALGMPTAFTDHADFTGMTTDVPLKIAAVLHEAFIAVDEDGTEAAAATAVVMEVGAAPIEPIKVTFDRPFLFVIHDVESATPLFIGRVDDPTA
jgi:serpin B